MTPKLAQAAAIGALVLASPLASAAGSDPPRAVTAPTAAAARATKPASAAKPAPTSRAPAPQRSSGADLHALGEIGKGLESVQAGASGAQAKFLRGVASDMQAAHAQNKLTIEQPYEWLTFARPTDDAKPTVYVDSRTVTVSKSAGFAETQSASFRLDRRGQVVRHDAHVVGGMFGPAKTLSSSYSDSAGRPLGKVAGWVRWKMARSSVLAPPRPAK